MRVGSDASVLLSPSDLSAYLACPHLTTLELEVARKLREEPHTREALAQLVAEKGDLHEATLPCAASQHREGTSSRSSFRERLAPSTSRMRQRFRPCESGADVVYQATFAREGWRGRADFVVRVEEPSDLGDWSYEPYDTKLARTAKPAAVLQLAFYARRSPRSRVALPERLHVVLGTSEVETYRPADVDAFLRRRSGASATHLDSPRRRRIPWPCEHCARCDFIPVCHAQWRDDDHLTRVAGDPA